MRVRRREQDVLARDSGLLRDEAACLHNDVARQRDEIGDHDRRLRATGFEHERLRMQIVEHLA